jgi:hypothetical protein
LAINSGLIMIASLFLGCSFKLSDKIGQDVVLEGKVSQTPWQHMIQDLPKKVITYFDLDGGNQIVVYTTEEIPCTGRIRLEGRVILTEGESKRPGSKEKYSEVQLDVTRWSCLPDQGDQGTGPFEKLLERLVDQNVTREDKQQVETELLKAGKDAIPVLIGHLKDDRPCWIEDSIANLAELTNRPVGDKTEPKVVKRPVALAERCNDLLLWIITPAGYRSPFEHVFKPRSIGGGMFRVEDWKAWWQRHQGESLEQIRDGVKPAIDAYFKSNGEEQVVR